MQIHNYALFKKRLPLLLGLIFVWFRREGLMVSVLPIGRETGIFEKVKNAYEFEIVGLLIEAVGCGGVLRFCGL